MEKLVITAAVAGSQTTKEQTPFLPLTPEEIAEEAYRCFNAGASMVHIHPRDPRKEVSDIEVLGEAVRLIREKCNIIIQAGTGGRDRFGKHREDGDRLKLLEINPKPDMISVNTGSFFFHSLTRKRPSGAPEGYFLHINPPALVESFVKGAKERGIGFEFEIYDSGGFFEVERLFEKGILEKGEKLNFNFVMGVGGGIPAKPKSLFFLMENLPLHSHWSVMGIGRNEYPMITLGMVLGSGGARVGLEDNIYLSKGALAKGNADLVEKAVRLANDLGREIASVAEARKMLSIGKEEGVL
jgi:3-keto-5-aminohexanoate cleavage enzyme